MELSDIIDKLLPPGTPESVRKKAMKFGRENPEYSELEIIAMFKPSMERAERVEQKRRDKSSKDTAAAKRKITKAEGKKNKAEMAYGGMANGKKHMYTAGGSVTDNPGLRALRASGPKGMEAYKKITGQ